MERRDFMTSVGSLMALGTLSTPMVGYATTGGLMLADTSESGLDAYLGELKEQIRRIERSALQPDLRRYFRQRGFPGRMSKDMARMMLVTSAVRDLPAELQEHPKVQRRLRREAPRIARTVMRLTDFIKGHSPEELKTIQTHLQEHPDLGDEIKANLTGFTHRQDLPPERREQTRQLMESTVWKMTHQSPNLMLDDYTQKVDRITAAAGFQQDQWEAHYAVVNDAPEAYMTIPQGALDERHPVLLAGMVIMGIGGAVAGVGLLVMPFEFTVGATATCVGGGIAFAGMVVAVIGAILWTLNQRQEAG